MSDPGPDLPEPHLLVVDDDARLGELLRRYLSDSGFRVTIAGDAGEARAHLASFAFDLVVLDVMMPGESGFDLTRALRREGRVPILLLTAMAEPEDRVNGLEQGADDYLSKPFEPRELVLRIRNILQRRPAAHTAPREIRFGGCRFDLIRGELFRGGDVMHLTAAEAGLLSALAQKAGQAVSREELSLSAQFSGNVRNCRCPDDAAAPQDRARSALSALPADRPRHRLCPQARLTAIGWRRRRASSKQQWIRSGPEAEPRAEFDIRPRGWIKRVLPRTMFGRSLLIVVVPLVLLQAIATWIFYDRHWAAVSWRLSAGVAGDIALLIEAMQLAGSRSRHRPAARKGCGGDRPRFRRKPRLRSSLRRCRRAARCSKSS